MSLSPTSGEDVYLTTVFQESVFPGLAPHWVGGEVGVCHRGPGTADETRYDATEAGISVPGRQGVIAAGPHVTGKVTLQGRPQTGQLIHA